MKFLFVQLFFSIIFLSPCFSQTGTIVVERPDSTKPPALRPHTYWIGVERYNGLEQIGQYFTPWKANDSNLVIHDGWGGTICSRHYIPIAGGRSIAHLTLKTGLTAFHTSHRKSTWSSPVSLGIGYYPFNNFGISGMAGARYFYSGGDPRIAERFKFEYGGGLCFNLFNVLYLRKPRVSLPLCWPFVEIQVRVIDHELFSYFQVEIPIPRLNKSKRTIPGTPDPLDR